MGSDGGGGVGRMAAVVLCLELSISLLLELSGRIMINMYCLFGVG